MANPLMLTNLQAVGGAELVKLQKHCRKMLGLSEQSLAFPGSQPVSFEREDLAKLVEQVRTSGVWPAYYVAEKTDGMRYMLMILPPELGQGAFMIDRNFNMRRLPVQFPSVKSGAFLNFTLLDGELVEDTDLSTGQISLRYLIYDACVVDNRKVTQETLLGRLMAVRHRVLKPWFEQVPFDPRLFRIELKDQYELAQLNHLFEFTAPAADKSKHLFTFTDVKQMEVRRPDDGAETMVVTTHNLRHGTDGTIFTPVATPYVHGTDQKVLKWKPAEMNSVDFAWTREYKHESEDQGMTSRFLLWTAENRVLQPVAWIEMDAEEEFRLNREINKRPRGSEHVIVECVWDPTKTARRYSREWRDEPTWEAAFVELVRTGSWRFERVRIDKTMPNTKSTMESVKKSIQDNVTKEELLAAFSS